MTDSLLADLIAKILDIYRDIDRQTASFQMATGLRCPSRCGACCESARVESTVLECLPLANEILLRGEEDFFFTAIQEKISRGDNRCVVFSPDEKTPGDGSCSRYDFRALVCRLFGFAARKNKFGEPEPSWCRVIKEKNPEILKKMEEEGGYLASAPIYQDNFMRIASLHPGLGYRLLPINVALRDALSYMGFRKMERL